MPEYVCAGCQKLITEDGVRGRKTGLYFHTPILHTTMISFNGDTDQGPHTNCHAAYAIRTKKDFSDVFVPIER